MVFRNLEKRLRETFLVLGLTASAMFPSYNAMADTIYYGKVKDAKKAAYIDWNVVKEASKYTAELDKMDNNDPKYDTIKEKRNKSVKNAIKNVGREDNYDVIVEKGDPKIANYKNINSRVKDKIKDIEK